MTDLPVGSYVMYGDYPGARDLTGIVIGLGVSSSGVPCYRVRHVFSRPDAPGFLIARSDVELVPDPRRS